MQEFQQIGDYKVLTILDPGNIKCVYLVSYNLQDRFAAKVMRIRNSQNLAFNEVKILEQMNHENVIKMKSFFVWKNYDQQYLVIIMDYCSNGNLTKIVGNTFDGTKIKRYMIEMAKGVAHLHQKFIIHRDLKPANIFFGHKGLILGDFSISKILKSHTDLALTFAGTQQYMDSKIISGKQYGLEVDIWSLGIIFIELLTGRNITELIPKNTIPSKIFNFYNDDLKKKIGGDKKYVDLIEGMLKKDSSRFTIFKVLQFLGVEQEINI